ncbi:MAG TPA: aminotransferase class V-fold PLP-dependent enzyme [Acidimicrobiales bacterium]|nr:aminotransferase class V-fold PLP-dependent enzyme [Acidimicrobiales bacterium]
MPLPPTGRPADEVLAELDDRRAGDVEYRSGRAFSLAYDAGDEVYDVATRALSAFHSTNALNPFAFPSLGRMQSEVVHMIADLLNGGPDAAGFMTSGGTESILLAVEAARNRGRAERGIDAPEMVVPTTAHAAFTKGSEYFGVKIVRVPVGDDFKAVPDAMAEHVNDNTVLLACSAPSYPQGVIDPVAAVAAIAGERGVNCHVDCCMGGITLPMLERLGYPIPPFDFRVPGVTSISVDLHKYGYTAKGASVILHRNKGLRRYHTFVTDDWLGGFYASSGVLGTKSGGPIAAAWAVLNFVGEDGYLRLTREARLATEDLVAALRGIPGVRVLGEPEATLVAFTIDGVDVFAVGNALWARGWFADQQGPPPSLHCTVNAVHRGRIDEFVAAIRDAIDTVRTASAEGEQMPYATLE